jgi:hypothetical protein
VGRREYSKKGGLGECYLSLTVKNRRFVRDIEQPRFHRLGGMQIIRSGQVLAWGALDVPLFGLSRAWDGSEVSPALAFSVVWDPERLWFIAAHSRAAHLHPGAQPGCFQAELWKYDVAELFLSNPIHGHYLELNLAANGAWWSCEFTAPRLRRFTDDTPFPGVETHATQTPDGGWVSAMSIPVVELEARIGFGEGSCGNVTFITGAPASRYVSAVKLPGTEPDFHQPAHFSKLIWMDVDLPR